MYRRFSQWGSASVVSALTALALLVPAQVGQAANVGQAKAGQVRAAIPRVVGAQPATGTPHFPPSTKAVEQIRQLTECGGIMYAVGRFSLVEQGGHTYNRNYA